MGEIRVGVFGVGGKMGSEVARAVEAAEGMVGIGGVDVDGSRDDLREAQVVVDFTHPDAVMDNIEWAFANGIHQVIGTTGFNAERLERVRELCSQHPDVGILIASNFSIGAVLMMKFAALAAPFFPSVEIVELHHPGKAEAPSGTATTTALKVAEARAAANMGPVPDATVLDGGARGAVVEGIHIHGVRLQGLVAHQEVLLGAAGETLTIRHDSFERTSFMPGVVAGIRHVVDHPGFTDRIEDVLGI